MRGHDAGRSALLRTVGAQRCWDGEYDKRVARACTGTVLAMRRSWLGAIVVALVLVTARAHVVAAVGSSDVVQRAIDDVQAFWATQLPTVSGT